MTHPKHTPGPWRAVDGQVFGPDPHEDGEVLICETAPDGAALTEYDAANAEAIACLPDLTAERDTLRAEVARLREALLCAESALGKVGYALGCDGRTADGITKMGAVLRIDAVTHDLRAALADAGGAK